MTSPFGVPVLPRPCSPAEAVERARRLLADQKLGNDVRSYQLGTGDYVPDPGPERAYLDVPWTDSRLEILGSDCAGFALCWCYRLRRHRPGFNRGEWATVSDDLNVSSALEDSEHARELFAPADGAPQPGDLLCYPTIRLEGHPQPWIGHVGIVIGVDRAGTWQPGWYELLDVAQCCGPNGRMPAVIATDGSAWLHHDLRWPKPEHRTRVLRVVG